MVNFSDKYLTNYYGYDDYLLNKTSNFCLSPLVLAFGKRIKITRLPGKSPYDLNYTTEKTHHLSIRLLCAVGAFVLFPLTLSGILLRKISGSHDKKVEANNKILYPIFLKNKLNELNRLLDGLNNRLSECVFLLNGLKNKLKEEDLSLEDSDKQFLIKKIARQKVMCQVILQRAIDQLMVLAICIHEVIQIAMPDDLVPYFDLYHQKLYLLLPILIKHMEKLNKHTINEENRFKKNVYYQLLELKKSLSLMIRNQQAYQENLPINIKFHEVHLFIRQIYYELFSYRHFFVNNSYVEGEISALSLNPKNIVGLENLTNVDFLSDIQAIFDQAVNPLAIQWIQETNSRMLINIKHSNNQLKLPSQLYQKNQLVFSSNHKDSLSFKSARHITQTIQNIENSKKKNTEYEKIFNLMIQNFEEWTQDLQSDRKENHLKNIFESYQSFSSNWKNDLKVLWTFEPEKFETDLLPRMKRFCKRLKTLQNEQISIKSHEYAQHLQKQFMEYIFRQKKHLPSYQDQDHTLFRDSYPVVFGTVYPQNNENTDSYEYSRSLKLGKEKGVPFVFVPKDQVEETKEYLQNENIKVYDLQVLKISTYLHRFIAAKKQPKIFINPPYIKFKWNYLSKKLN